MQITIEKGVALPNFKAGAGRGRFPFRDLEVGDSFYIPFGDDMTKTRSVVSNAIAAFKLRNAPKDFTSRRDETGVRVWRTA